MSERKNMKKTRAGVVVSDKMDKTITVLVEEKIKHPIYKKYYKKSVKFMAHDEKNDCNEGDTVKIIENKKISKNKSWRLLNIIERKQ